MVLIHPLCHGESGDLSPGSRQPQQWISTKCVSSYFKWEERQSERQPKLARQAASKKNSSEKIVWSS